MVNFGALYYLIRSGSNAQLSSLYAAEMNCEVTKLSNIKFDVFVRSFRMSVQISKKRGMIMIFYKNLNESLEQIFIGSAIEFNVLAC